MTPLPSDPYAAAAELADRRNRAEVAVVEATLSDPATAVPLLAAAGVTVETFENADLGILYAAAAFKMELPIETILCGARRVLQHYGWWDPSGPIGSGSRWS